MTASPMTGPTRREITAWAFYDFAASAFNTLVVTFIFSQFFTRAIAADPIDGAVAWTRAVNISAIAVAVLTPVLGAMADYSGRKKIFLFVASALAVVFSALLFLPGPGDVTQALVFFVIANIGFEGALVFYNAFLPELSEPGNSGRISGFGWGLGYVGGLIAMFIALGMMSWLPDDGHTNVRATNLLVAAWYALFSIPLFLLVRERAHRHPGNVATYARAGFGRVAATVRRLGAFREAAKLLLARMIYNDGLVTIFAFAAIYAAARYGMDTAGIIRLGIALNVAAGFGAFAFGWINDRIGGKRTIAITLVVLTLATIYGAMADTVREFWIAGVFIGLMIGPNQSASRSLLANFVPADKQGEFFGFFAFSGRLAAVAGPFAYGTILSITENHQYAMSSIIIFFVLGGIVLWFVDERAGIENARRLSPATAVQEEAVR